MFNTPAPSGGPGRGATWNTEWMEDGAAILAGAVTVAVVGASRDPRKAGGSAPAGLQPHGFRLIPVNPLAAGQTLFGEMVYARLEDIPGRVDIVDVFRPAADAPQIAREAVAIGAGALWLQEGIVSAEARRIAEAAGMDYVEDLCISVVRALYRIHARS